MSLTPVVGSPESSHQVFDGAETSQWSQEAEPATQNGMIQEWTEAPPPAPVPVSSNGTNPGFYTNGLSFNGNGTIPLTSNNITVPFERNVANTNGIYVMNGVRPPHNILSPGMIRPNGFAPNIMNGGNGYINAIANGRYIRAPGWVTTNKVSNGVKKQKRNRTAFTSHQMMELEQEYTRTRYLDRNRRIELSEILNLNQRTIKIWFQNRRMKEKKDRAESLEESEEVSTTESSPELANDIPTFIHEQYPVTVTSNEIYNRGGLYMDHYPVSSTPSAMPSTMPQIPNQMPNDFMEYVPDNSFDPQSQCRQVHLQVQHFNPVFNTGVQEVPQETAQADSCTTDAPSAMPESWDLSWIRSIQAEEEF